MHHCSVISWPKTYRSWRVLLLQPDTAALSPHYHAMGSSSSDQSLKSKVPIWSSSCDKVEFQLHGGIVDAHKLRVHLLLTKSLKKENQVKCKAILESHPKLVLPELFFCLAITFTMKQGCADQYIPTLKSNLWIVVVDDLVLSTFKGHL